MLVASPPAVGGIAPTPRADQPRWSSPRRGRNSAAPGPLGDRQPGLRVDPPRQEVGDPAVGVGVAGSANIGPHAAGRAVAADHVEELVRREMRQLVETDQRDLRTLPVIDGAVELQVREFDLAAPRPAPLAHSDVWRSANPGIEFLALIPQSAGIGDLRCGAPEEHRGEVRDPGGVAQRLQDQPDRFSAAGRPAVDADIGRAPKEVGLPSGLPGDCGCRRTLGATRCARRPLDAIGVPVSYSGHVLSFETCDRGFLEKYRSCASRSACVNSGSRLLSGKTTITSALGSPIACEIGSFGAAPSRQCARVFSQKMIAGMLPAAA